MINIGIIGYGYWGPNLVRNFAETPGANVAAVSDLDTTKLALVQRRFPAVRTTTDFRDLLNDPVIDAIAIATPVHTHFELALAALRAGQACLARKADDRNLRASPRTWSMKRKRATWCCWSTTPSSIPAR